MWTRQGGRSTSSWMAGSRASCKVTVLRPAPFYVMINAGMAQSEGYSDSDLPLWGQENYDSWSVDDMLELWREHDQGDQRRQSRALRLGRWSGLHGALSIHMQHIASNGGWFWEDPWELRTGGNYHY